MQRQVGQILLRELSDPRIDPARTSITRVEVQEDLLVAKVYISVMGTPAQGKLTLEALQHAAGRIRILLRDEIDLRYMPQVEFLTDENFKTALKTWEILRQVSQELREKEEKAAGAAAPEAVPEDAPEDAPDATPEGTSEPAPPPAPEEKPAEPPEDTPKENPQ
jgi:ribosome-binding factor A